MSGDFKSLADLHNEVLYSTLCGGINNLEDVKHLKDLFKDATTLHYDLFTDSIFYKKIEGPDSNSVIEYILPTIRRAYSKFFINTPSIFSSANNYGSQIKNYRLELFQLQFNLRDFLEFLSEKFLKNNDKLNDFKNLDTNSEILTLIVEDYVGSKVSYVSSVSSDELQKEIRDIKLSRHLSI